MSILSKPVMLQQCPLVKKCPATGRRIIRYMGVQPRGKTVIMCQELAFAEGQEEGTDVCEGAQKTEANPPTRPIDARPKGVLRPCMAGVS